MRCLRCGTDNPDTANTCFKCNATLRRTCPRCRAVNYQKQIFCGNCGLKLINVCPRCKAHNSPIQKYCGNCGLKIINFCPKCGMNNPIGQRFCGSCATKLLPAQTGKPPARQPQPVRRPDQQQGRGHVPPQRPAHSPVQPSQQPQARRQPPVRQKSNLPPPAQAGQRTAHSASEIGRQLRQQQQQRPVRQPPAQKQPRPEPVEKVKPESQPVAREAPPAVQEKPVEPVKQAPVQAPPVQKPQPAPVQEKPVVKEPQAAEPPPEPAPPAIETPEKPPELQPVVEEKPEQVEPASLIPDIEEKPADIPEGFSQIEEDIKQPEMEVLPEPELVPVSAPEEEETAKVSDLAIEEGVKVEEISDDEEAEEEVSEDEFSLDNVAQSLAEPPKPEELYDELTRFAVLSTEIVNFSTLAEKLEATVLNNIKDKVWSVIRNAAQNNSEDLVEVSENIGVIAFTHSENKQHSSILAVQVAGEIFNFIGILNQQFESALETEVKIKIGIAFNDSEGVSQLERSIASAKSIVVSEEIKKDTEGICQYDTIGPLPIGNQMVTFYKYRIPDAEDAMSLEEASIAAKSPGVAADFSKKHEDDFPIAPPSVDEEEPIPEVDTKTVNKDTAIGSLINICSLADSTGKGQFVGILGEDGCGKSTIIRALKASLSPQSFIWLIARCNYQEQIMPLSAIRNLLRNFFGLPQIIYNREEARATIKNGVESIVGPNEQLCYVINGLILGEEISGLTKPHVINALFTIIRAISEKATPLVVIEDLDAIDNTSFEILEALLETGILDTRAVMIATFHPNLNFVESKPHVVKLIKYSQMSIKPVEREEIPKTISDIVQAELTLPDHLLEQLANASAGMPFHIENALYLMYELGVVINTETGPAYNEEAAQWELPPNIQEILRLRLHRLSQVNPNAFMLLQMAGTLGPKFSPSVLQDLSLMGKQFDEIMQFLISLGYLLLEDQNMMVFKHNIVWELIYYAGIPNENKAQYHMQVLTYLEKVQQSGGRMDLAYIAYHAENAGKKRKCLNYWNLVANQVLALGVTTGYSETMMRYINVLEESDLHNKKELQLNALEGVAKVVHITDPDLAIQAFQKVLPEREIEDSTPRLLELRGHLSLSFEQLGRWDEAIDQIDKSLEMINPDTMPVERIILLTSKLSAMDSMGKIGWILSTCKNEIFPVLEKALKEERYPEGMTDDQLYRIYCSAKIAFANALIASGHQEAFNVFNEIMPEIEKRGLQDLGLKAYILQAKWRAIRGEVEFAEKILAQTREYLTQIPGINHFSLLWGEAACYLNLEIGNWEALANIIDGLRIQAKKLNNYQVIALTKICKGLIAQVSGQQEEALNIFNDSINYASQYKLSMFALMSWYFVSATELQSKNYDNAESIATRALDVAKMPDIYNLSALITLNRLLGEIYIRKNELEKAGAHLEEAWKIATETENHSQVAKVAVTIGQMYQELISLSDENKKENAEKAYEFLSNALNIFNQLGHPLHTRRAEQALENLKVVCKVNNISI